MHTHHAQHQAAQLLQVHSAAICQGQAATLHAYVHTHTRTHTHTHHAQHRAAQLFQVQGAAICQGQAAALLACTKDGCSHCVHVVCSGPRTPVFIGRQETCCCFYFCPTMHTIITVICGNRKHHRWLQPLRAWCVQRPLHSCFYWKARDICFYNCPTMHRIMAVICGIRGKPKMAVAIACTWCVQRTSHFCFIGK